MFIVWDSIDQLKLNEEWTTAIIEAITIFSAIIIVLVLFSLKKKYPKLTKKGFVELSLGFSILAAHFLFDLLDTLVTKKIGGVNTQAYLIFDELDAIFNICGLILIGFGFYRIAKYGMELWEGK